MAEIPMLLGQRPTGLSREATDLKGFNNQLRLLLICMQLGQNIWIVDTAPLP